MTSPESAEAQNAPSTQSAPPNPFQIRDSLINYQVAGSPFSSGEVASSGPQSREALIAAQTAGGRGPIDVLFDKSVVPTMGVDVSTQTLATQFQVAADGLSILAISYYWNVDKQQVRTQIGVFDQSGVLLTSMWVTPPAYWGWLLTPLSPPVPLTPGQPYWVAYLSQQHAFPQQPNYTWSFSSRPGGLATVLGGGSAAGPNLTAPLPTNTCYFVDANVG